MKNLWLSLLLTALFFTLSAQEFPVNESTGKVEYVEVVDVSGATADDLYNRALEWFDNFYTNANSVIEKKEAGQQIFGKHKINLYANVDDTKVHKGFVNYYIDIKFKDGRYRYEINNFFKIEGVKVYISEWIDSGASNQDVLNDYLNQVNVFMEDLTTQLKDRMEQPLEDETEDDW